MIYHSITEADWEKAKATGYYAPSSLETQGFIHCSTLDQLVAITNLVFQKRADIVILEIDETRVTAKIISEDLKRHGRFPHIYGKLNIDAVVATYPMSIDNNPTSKVSFLLPEKLVQTPISLN